MFQNTIVLNCSGDVIRRYAMINYTNNIVYSTLNVKCYSVVCWLVDKSGGVIITLYTACQSTVHPSPDMRLAVNDQQTQDVDPMLF